MGSATKQARNPGAKTKKGEGKAKRRQLVSKGSNGDAATVAPIPADLTAAREWVARARGKLDALPFTDADKRGALEREVDAAEAQLAELELRTIEPIEGNVIEQMISAAEQSAVEVPLIVVTDPTQTARMTGPEIDRLAKQITAAGGLLHPIGVKALANGKNFELIWGARRLAATIRLGGDVIDARVFPASITAEQVEMLRTLENFGRENLTPADRCIAVANMLASIDRTLADDNAAEAIILRELIKVAGSREAYVGRLLGRPEDWVRDRAYVAKLGGRARNLLAAGRLDLSAARELAKLGDPAAADAIAEASARDHNGGGGRPLAWVREQVLAHTRDLKRVPWRLDIAFGEDKAKGCEGWACATCPFNAVTQPLLFGLTTAADGEADEMIAGICTNAPCFEAKQTAANKLLDKRIEKIAKGKGATQDVNPTRAELEAQAPEQIRPEVFVRETRKVLAENATAADVDRLGNAPDGGDPAPAPKSKKGDAQIARENALAKLDKWGATASRAICKAIDGKPGRNLYFAAMRNANQLRSMGRTGDAKGEEKARRVATSAPMRTLFKRWAKPELRDLIALEKQSPHSAESWRNELSGLVPEALAAIAEALGVKLDDAPEVPDAGK